MSDEQPRIVLKRGQLALVTLGMLMSMMLSALDTSIVATAMPRIIADLSGLQYYAWVTTAYLVTSTTIVPISGKLGDLFGRKRFLQGGMIGFLTASALCGIAPSMPFLVAARAVQGIFGGFLTSSALASMADLYLPATRAKMQGVFASVFAIGAIAGPILGGILTDAYGWRSVFYVNIPVGAVAFALVYTTMPFIRTRASWRNIDVRGAVLLAAGLIPFLVGLTASRAGASATLVVALFAVAVVMLVGFVLHERDAEHPIMPLTLFRIPTFSVAIVVSFLSAFGVFGSNIFVPLVYQGLLGLTPTQSGVYMTPRMIGMVIASLISGQIVSRVTRYRFVSAAGLAILALGVFLLSRVDSTTSDLDVARDLLFVGIGFGSNQPIYQNAVMSAVPFAYVGVASSQVQFWRSLGQTVGVTIFGVILALAVGTGTTQSEEIIVTSGTPSVALASGLHGIFLVATGAVAIAMVLALALREVPFRGRRTEAPAPVAAAATAAIGED